MRPDFRAASSITAPSAGVCDMGFSQYTSFPAPNASTTTCRCQWSGTATTTQSTSLLANTSW